MITLLRHWGYGLVLAWLIPVVEARYAEQVTGAHRMAGTTRASG